jgi:D-xylose transport system permease protein
MVAGRGDRGSGARTSDGRGSVITADGTSSPTQALADGGPPRWHALRAISWRAYGMVLVLLAIWVFFQVRTDGLFLSSANMTNLLRQACLVGILAIGMVLIIVSGHIDLSAGSAVGLVAIVAAELQIEHGMSTVPTIVLALLTGIALGVWNGLWVAYGGVPSFVVTLGGLLAFRGIALVLTKGYTFAPFDESFTKVFQQFLGPTVSVVLVAVVFAVGATALILRLRHSGRPTPSLGVNVAIAAIAVAAACSYFAWVFADNRGMPMPILILAVLAAVFSFVARRTRFGRRLYAIGGNPEAARLAGINIARNTFLVFVLMGLLYGIVGVLLGARLDSAPPNGGSFMELDAIAAAVIGGTSLMGGVGTIGGALVGALLLQSIANGMSLENIQSDYQLIVTGLILTVAVYIDMAAKRRRRA